MPYLIGPLFLVVGSLVVVSTIRGRRRAVASSGWPVVQGRIVRSEMSRSVDPNGIKTSASLDQGIYKPLIEFTYTVGGAEYSSDTFTLSVYSTDSETASAIVGRYPIGAPAIVHYNPEDPSEATLETGENTFGTIFMLILAGFFAFAGLLVTIVEALVLIVKS